MQLLSGHMVESCENCMRVKQPNLTELFTWVYVRVAIPRPRVHHASALDIIQVLQQY